MNIVKRYAQTLAAIGCLLCALVSGADLPRAKPEQVGLSSERLARINALLKANGTYFSHY